MFYTCVEAKYMISTLGSIPVNLRQQSYDLSSKHWLIFRYIAVTLRIIYVTLVLVIATPINGPKRMARAFRQLILEV